jgi:hypothetical protein
MLRRRLRNGPADAACLVNTINPVLKSCNWGPPLVMTVATRLAVVLICCLASPSDSTCAVSGNGTGKKPHDGRAENDLKRRSRWRIEECRVRWQRDDRP